jgi:ATP-dependent Zn protease
MDQESGSLLNDAYLEAINILTAKRDKVKGLIDELLDKNTLTGKEFGEYLNQQMIP